MSSNHLDQIALIRNMPASGPDGREAGILAIHGRNQEPAFMEKILSRLGWEDHTAVIPAAAEKSWYPDKFMAPLEVNKLKLDEALHCIAHYHQTLRSKGFKDDQIIILGFSQGACLAAQYALQHPSRYKGVIILTGGYIGPQDVAWDFSGDFDQTPVYISTSKIDEWVPPSRAEETAKEFERMRAKVTYQLFEDRPHEVSDQEIAFLAGWA